MPCRTSGRRGFRPTWPSHAWLTGMRALVLRDSVWTLTRLGSLNVDERLREDASHPARRAHVCPERLRARLPALPAPRAHDTWLVPRRQSARGQRYNSGLTALRATELLVSLVSVLCVVYGGSYGGRNVIHVKYVIHVIHVEYVIHVNT